MQIIDDSSDNQISGSFVQTIGFFDGVHCGHQYLLRQVTDEAARRGLKSMVVTFRLPPRQVLDPKSSIPLLTTLQEKLRLIEQCGIDSVALLDFTPELAETGARRYMERTLRSRLHGKALVIGYDNRFGKRDGNGFAEYRQYGEELGLEVIQALPLPAKYCLQASSTVVRNALAEGDIVTATCILGRPYSISGTVTHGQAIGRAIGFPTANITLDSSEKLVPKTGVYATTVTVGNSCFGGMLYIGKRPSIRSCSEPRMEVNLFDFNEEIYGCRICVNIISRIRDEQQFESLDLLQAQLAKDKEQAIKLVRK